MPKPGHAFKDKAPISPIITSLLDTDLYKFTMMQCVLHQFPKAEVEYRFIARKPIDLRPYAQEIKEEVAKLCDLRFTEEELEYLASQPYIKKDFIDFLRNFKLNLANIEITNHDAFGIHIRGPWVDTILFEVPVLAIVSEVYYRNTYPIPNFEEGKNRLQAKIAYLKTTHPELKFTDFGTRRRFSKAWHQQLLTILKQELPTQFDGTSNVYFAKALNLWPIGTMAHEFLQAAQVLAPQLKGCQNFALNIWLKEYPNALGIALTDSLTMDIFLQEFDKTLANRYIGLRQDSGDPIAWGEKALKHYEALGIPTKDKIFVFSDSLNVQRAAAIFDHFKSRCRPFFGIGTNLTNDLGYTPLDIVIKMTQTNHQPVIKISDTPGKIVCEDSAYLKHVKEVFDLKD